MKTEQELKRARAALVEKNTEIMNLETKLERLYEQQRELVNYLDLNKCDGIAVTIDGLFPQLRQSHRSSG